MKALGCRRCIGKRERDWLDKLTKIFFRYGTVDHYHAMVLEMLGPSIEDLYNYCHRRFSIKTVLLLGEQMLERICHIHRRAVIHRE